MSCAAVERQTHVAVIRGDALNQMEAMRFGSVDLIYMDPPFDTGRDFGQFTDRWISRRAYISWLTMVCSAARDTLSDTGNLLLHVDWRTVHYLKVALDEVFGVDQFRNEIIWAFASGGASKRHLARKHNTILWYSKSDNYTFNVLREPYATPGVDGRAGFHPDGRMLTDVWQLSFLSTTARERTGWPTQKPLALLERAIQVFTDRGDLVVDPFCGSGTTGLAALRHGRRYQLSDLSEQAVALTRARLAEEGGAC